MTDKPLPPLTEAAIFEAGYLASTLRARRELSWPKRLAIMRVLAGAKPDPRFAVPETPQHKLRSFALILARCESAATLLGWRKQISPEQKHCLDAAVHCLQEAAAQVAVRSCVPSSPGRSRYRIAGRKLPRTESPGGA